MRGWIGAVALALVACAPQVEPESSFERSNLEQARVTPSSEVTGRIDVLGLVTIEADGTGWEVTVTSSSAAFTVEVVSRGGADLSVFDGRVARLAVAEIPGTREHAMALLTPEGEVLYLLEPVAPGQLTESGFGQGLLGRGNDLGPVRRGGWEVELQSAWLRTDGAELELLPGSPMGVHLRGETYRVVLLSAWDLTDQADSCDLAGSRLAFEVVRIESGPVDEVPLERSPEVPLVGESCEDDA
jgi:hypothetical protein